MAERIAACGGGVGQIYDQDSKLFDTVVKQYLLAWAALLDDADPSLAIANTVEIQSLSGQTIGLIVLPAHPMRSSPGKSPTIISFSIHASIRAWPRSKSGMNSACWTAMFPAFLPGLEQTKSFVFADTLGFHAVGMVPDDDREPKAAMANLSVFRRK